jgi:SAM-dependent methyltransferase
MKRLLVKSEFLLQSLVRYPLAARCPHCGSARQQLVARKYRIARIVRCRDCGLCFSRPIYRSWLSGSFYDRLYSAEGSVTTLPDDARLQQLVAGGFRETDKDATQVLQKLRAHPLPERPTLLEIGSSWGYFLHQAREMGFAVTGVEIGTRRREFGRQRLGLDIVGDLGELPAGRRYDVVYTAHVLEHFTDLRGVFPRLAALLADDGILFIEVPNFDPAQLGPRCLRIVGAVHPLGFDSGFFRHNLPRHGLAITGLFKSWRDLPDRSTAVSSGDVIIVRAARHREQRSYQ